LRLREKINFHTISPDWDLVLNEFPYRPGGNILPNMKKNNQFIYNLLKNYFPKENLQHPPSPLQRGNENLD